VGKGHDRENNCDRPGELVQVTSHDELRRLPPAERMRAYGEGPLMHTPQTLADHRGSRACYSRMGPLVCNHHGLYQYCWDIPQVEMEAACYASPPETSRQLGSRTVKSADSPGRFTAQARFAPESRARPRFADCTLTSAREPRREAVISSTPG
jgi:hypothetical protein